MQGFICYRQDFVLDVVGNWIPDSVAYAVQERGEEILCHCMILLGDQCKGNFSCQET